MRGRPRKSGVDQADSGSGSKQRDGDNQRPVATEHVDWQQWARKCARIADFLEPIAMIREIPGMVTALEAEKNRLGATIKLRKAQVEEVDQEVAKRRAELAQIDRKYEKVWTERQEDIERAGRKVEQEIQEQLNILQNSLTQGNRTLTELQSQIAQEKAVYQEEKRLLEAELTAKRQQMQDLNAALAQLLKA